jgi:hypothetical protein
MASVAAGVPVPGMTVALMIVAAGFPWVRAGMAGVTAGRVVTAGVAA